MLATWTEEGLQGDAVVERMTKKFESCGYPNQKVTDNSLVADTLVFLSIVQFFGVQLKTTLFMMTDFTTFL